MGNLAISGSVNIYVVCIGSDDLHSLRLVVDPVLLAVGWHVSLGYHL